MLLYVSYMIMYCIDYRPAATACLTWNKRIIIIIIIIIILLGLL